MNFFILNKYQPVQENVTVTTKHLYDLLDEEIHVDELFQRFARNEGFTLSLNMERILYLSLTFLYSLGLIIIDNNLVKKVDYVY